MMAYTVRLRERGHKTWFYVNNDLEVQASHATGCKPLSRADADLAARLFVEGAKKEGREIVAQVVTVPDYP